MARFTAAVAAVALAGSAAATEYDYKVSSGRFNFADAREWCDTGSGFRGQLASITSSAEWNTIHNLVKSSKAGDYWLGLTRVSSDPHKWVYDDGEEVKESFNGESVWKKGEPNNWKQREHCVVVGRNSMEWNDANCGGRRKQHAVCKRVQVQNPYTHDGWSVFSPPGSGTDTCYYKYFNRVMMTKLSEHTRRSWFDAEGFCRGQLLGNGHLVSIESKEENSFIKDLLYNHNQEFENRPVWVGGRKTDGKWTWSNGAGFTYTNWIPGEPDEGADFLRQQLKNEHCTQYSHAKIGDGFARTDSGKAKKEIGEVGQWNNADCDKKRGWICEYCTDEF